MTNKINGKNYSGATVLRHEVRIDKPREEVFEIFSNFEAVPKYVEPVLKTIYVDDKRNCVGTARHCTLDNGQEVIERVTAWEEGRFTAMEIAEKMHVEFMEWVTYFDDYGSSTRVSQVLTYKIKKGILFSLMNRFMMRSMMNNLMNDIFVSMKTYAEKQDGATVKEAA